MGYAIVGYFDKYSDKKIRKLWQNLAETGICNYLYKSENNPHIKFSMFDELDVKQVQKKLQSYTHNKKKINLHFKNYGIYINKKPIVFLDISATIPVLKLQIDIQKEFNQYGVKTGFDFFEQGIWKPDCFITIGIEKENMIKAIKLLLDTKLPFNGYLERIGVIEFHPAKQLFSYSLQ